MWPDLLKTGDNCPRIIVSAKGKGGGSPGSPASAQDLVATCRFPTHGCVSASYLAICCGISSPLTRTPCSEMPSCTMETRNHTRILILTLVICSFHGTMTVRISVDRQENPWPGVCHAMPSPRRSVDVLQWTGGWPQAMDTVDDLPV